MQYAHDACMLTMPCLHMLLTGCHKDAKKGGACHEVSVTTFQVLDWLVCLLVLASLLLPAAEAHAWIFLPVHVFMGLFAFARLAELYKVLARIRLLFACVFCWAALRRCGCCLAGELRWALRTRAEPSGVG